MMTNVHLSVEPDGVVGRLSLARPQKGNALSPDLVSELGSGIDELLRTGIRILVLEGEGRHFCTGFDLSDLDAASDADLLARFVAIELLLQKLRRAPIPTVAIGRGRVTGAGAGADLFCSCDVRIALEGSSYAFPGAGFGIVLGTMRLANLVGRERALDLVMSGNKLSHSEAVSVGLATHSAHSDSREVIDLFALGARRLDGDTVASLREATASMDEDRSLANLVRSASRPGLGDRIRRYRNALQKSAPV